MTHLIKKNYFYKERSKRNDPTDGTCCINKACINRRKIVQ